MFHEMILLKWAHILAMVYWLGGEWGVFQTSYNVVNRKLALDERRRHMALDGVTADHGGVAGDGVLGNAEFLLLRRDGVVVEFGGAHSVAGRLHVGDPLVAAHAAFVEQHLHRLAGHGERGGRGEDKGNENTEFHDLACV